MKLIEKIQTWLGSLFGNNETITKDLHLDYALGDRSVAAYVLGVLLLFAAHLLPVTNLLVLLAVVTMAYVGALCAMAGYDAVLFGKVLCWMPLGSTRQILPELAKAQGHDSDMERATQSYRLFQHPTNVALVAVAALAMPHWLGALALAVGLFLSMWSGSHDDLYHWVLKHVAVKSREETEPWKWWTPVGIYMGLVHKEPPTQAHNYYQARWAAVIGLALALSGSAAGYLI
jgi:hypothetical protein